MWESREIFTLRAELSRRACVSQEIERWIPQNVVRTCKLNQISDAVLVVPCLSGIWEGCRTQI